jgi:hypothetical protein
LSTGFAPCFVNEDTPHRVTLDSSTSAISFMT